MASGISDFIEAQLLNTLLGGNTGGEPYVPPANVFIALFTARGTNAQSDANTNWTEVTGGSYARASVANTIAQWAHLNTVTPAATNTKSNVNTINFITPTADWGTVIAFAIYDAVTSGNLMAWADLGSNKVIQTGDPVQFNAGQLTCNFE